MISERLALSEEVQCDEAYTKSEPYADTDKYMKQLFTDLDVEPINLEGAMSGLVVTTVGLSATTLAFLF